MNDRGKLQDDIAKSDKQAHEMIGKLEAAERCITPQHVALRFRELLDDIGQGIFGIAVGRVWQEVTRELGQLPATQAVDSFVVAGPTITAAAASEGDLEKSCLRRSG